MKADIVKAQTVMNHLNIHNFNVWHCFEEGMGGTVLLGFDYLYSSVLCCCYGTQSQFVTPRIH